jgi:WD40 repeat protein
MSCRGCQAEVSVDWSRDELCPACMQRAQMSSVADAAFDPNATTMSESKAFQLIEGVCREAVQHSGRPFPRALADYLLLTEIARGGMGIVYRARQISLNRSVALKLILAGGLASPRDVERFHREAKAVAHLDHPHIVPIYEVGQHEGDHFFSMKFVEGGSLADRMPKMCAQPREGVRVLAKISRAIHYAHQRGVLHRDIKPSNILLDSSGEPYVGDFGLARRLDRDSTLTLSDGVVGTPNYMAPEQAGLTRTAVTTSADVYSLGAILYQVLTGRPPFTGDSPLDTLMLLISSDARRPRMLNPGVDRDLETIALKCLEKNPGRRYGSADALADDLDRWLANEPILARRVGRSERLLKWTRRRPLVASLTAGMLLITATGMGGVVWQWRNAEGERVRAEAARLAADSARQEAAQRATSEMHAREVAEQAQRREGEQRRLAETQEGIAQRALAVSESNLYANNVELAAREALAAHVTHADNLLDSSPKQLRSWEWHYLRRLAHMESAVIPVHADSVRALIVGSNSNQVMSAGNDLVVRISDLPTRRTITQVILDGPSAGDWDTTEFSADGKSLVVLSIRNEGAEASTSLHVWNTSTGRRRFALPSLQYSAFAVSPDAKRLMTVSTTGAKKFRAWDFDTGAELAAPPDVGGYVWNLVFSPDGKRVAATGDTDIKIIDTTSGSVPLTFKCSRCRAMAFSREGNSIVAGNAASGLSLWSVRDGRMGWSAALDAPVVAVAFSQDGMYIAVVLGDHTVRVLDASSGHELAVFTGHTAQARTVVFGRDSSQLFSAGDDGQICVWRFSLAERLPVLARDENRTVQGLAIAEKQGLIAAMIGDEFDKTLQVWDTTSAGEIFAANQHQVPRIPGGSPVFSHDGTLVIVPRIALLEKRNREFTTRTELDILDARTGKKKITLQTSQAGKETTDGIVLANYLRLEAAFPRGFNVTPRGDRAALVSQATTFTRTELGSTGVTGGSDVQVWATETGRLLTRITLGNRLGESVEFSPDGRRLAVAIAGQESGDRSFKDVAIYDTTTGGLLQRFQNAQPPIAFSHDGTYFAVTSTDRRIVIYSRSDAKYLVTFPQEANPVVAIAFSPDAKRLVSASDDGSVKVWDPASGRQMIVLGESSGPYQAREWVVAARPSRETAVRRASVYFSDDGRRITAVVISSEIGSVKIQERTWNGAPLSSFPE